MEKPKRPKKPKAFTEKPPTQEVEQYYYPRDKYLPNSLRTELVFFKSEEMPDGDDDSEDAQFWYDDHGSVESLTLDQLIAFAESKGVPPNKVKVTSFVPYGDAEYAEVELVVKEQLSDEEFTLALENYNARKEAHELKIAEYERKKAEYPRLKAEYELYIAQQKLAELGG